MEKDRKNSKSTPRSKRETLLETSKNESKQKKRPYNNNQNRDKKSDNRKRNMDSGDTFNKKSGKGTGANEPMETGS